MNKEQATKTAATAEMAKTVINSAPTAANKAHAEAMQKSGSLIIGGVPKPAGAATQVLPAKPEEAAPQEPKRPTAQELQADIQRKTAELQKCLEELTHKKRLSDHRSKFLESLDQLEEMRKAVKADSGEFETKNGAIRFYKSSNTSYRSSDDAILSISNTAIVLEMLDFIEVKIKAKIEAIESELIQ